MNEASLGRSISRLIGIRAAISTILLGSAAFGGEIQVSSQPGAGAIMAVRLPARAAVAP
jgi:signal transduction histidine kinase